ncbi:ATP-dependent RNA helicase DHX33-like [Mya arenaria]|uniref:ATP-dependent RNA helicase DHX33-like n=1 Tax=Mya arenaria TaxID=6604 RepID=UPI0022DF03A3|nr:ATP-dependent RNA helicase DHX33-like [Mya arenaria]
MNENGHRDGPSHKKFKFSQNGDDHYQKIRDERRQLPIYPARGRLISEVQRHSSVIVIGETGSGKTTQIPQFLLEAGVNRNAIIAVTQPRRVAAITLSQRVAQEKRSDIGKLVGYCVRFDDTTSEQTKIKYMTDGMLLREAISDPLMKRYSVVILDEAHERTIHTDVLFGVVKQAQRKRAKLAMKPLKIIVMSATMDVDHFSKYFNNAPVLYLEGRQYPIKVLYCKQEQSDYLFGALVTLFQIHREAPAQEDVLLFLTGQEEIDSAVKSIRDVSRTLTGDVPSMIICPLYAALPAQQQLKVFQPTPKGCRKVVVATNIAETSITISGVRFVIDSGMVKAKIYNARGGLDLMKVVHVSQAQAQQRCGRAGRESPGTCYRLYTEQQYEAFRKNTVPEIQRCNLASVVLQLLAMGIHDILHFDFMDKPDTDAVLSAIEQLKLLGALEPDDTELKLTVEGRQMSAFPLDPRLSKVLMAAKDYQCMEEVLTIVSLLSVDSVLYSPQGKREQALLARQKFLSSEGDHISLLNVYRAYKGVNGNKNWCMENYINMRNMKTAFDVRRQLRDICVKQALPIQTCGQDTAAIRKCLTTGFFMNSAELQKEGEYISLSTRKTVTIHPSSALFHCKPAYVLYNELVQTSKCYMRDLCVVDADWLYQTAPAYFKKKKPGG